MSGREANKEAATKAKATRHVKEQDRLIRRLSRQACTKDSDPTDDSISSSDDNAPSRADAYMKEGHNRANNRKGKGPVRKW